MLQRSFTVLAVEAHLLKEPLISSILNSNLYAADSVCVRTLYSPRLREFLPRVTKDDVMRVIFSSISSSLGVLQCGAVLGCGPVFLTEELLNLVATENLGFIGIAHL